MVTALVMVSIVALVKCSWTLSRDCEAVRRLKFALAGGLHLLLGILAAGSITWGGLSAALAAESAVDEPFPAETEEVATENVATTSSALSVSPAPQVIIPPGRPEWIAEARRLPADATWTAVSSDPCSSVAECEAELDRKVKQAADAYINHYLQSNMAASLLNYRGDELRRRLVPRDGVYSETIQVSFGPMEQLHARLEFTDDFRRELTERWHQVRVVSRLGQLGLIGAVVLALLGTAFGFFKANTATRGGRSSNLQMAAAATILMIVVAGVAAARYLYWL